jgi:transcriptional/translational regulatory protein YebC/TACO1
VRSALEGAELGFDSADVTMVPSSTVALENAEEARKVLRLIDALDDLDDVQDVYANFDIPDQLLATLSVDA